LRNANAGHDLPYLWHGGDAEELRARVMPLGQMLGMSYEQKEMVLEADEIALVYSDGLVEAYNPRSEIFGSPRPRTLVAEHGEEASLSNLLQEDPHPFTGAGWEQEDDITLFTL
jgi:serine phosphatase RsbU (regulator of sigma subunit)